MIPAADLKILEEIENRLDLRAALAALKANRNERTVPWEELKRKLGLVGRVPLAACRPG